MNRNADYDENLLLDKLADMSNKCFDVKYLRVTPTSQVYSKCREALGDLKVKLQKQTSSCKNLYDDPIIDYASTFQMRVISYIRQSCFETLHSIDGVLKNFENNRFGKQYTDALISQSGYALGLGVATLTKHDILIDLFDHIYDDEEAQKEYPELMKCVQEEADERKLAGFDGDDTYFARHKQMIGDLFISEREVVSPFIVVKNKPDDDDISL